MVYPRLRPHRHPAVLHRAEDPAELAQGAIPDDYTPNMYAYKLAFTYSQFNYASAISFALGTVVFVASYIFLFSPASRAELK